MTSGKTSIILASFPIQYMTLSLGLFSLANLLAYAGWPGFFPIASSVYVVTFVGILLRSIVWPDLFHQEIRRPNEISIYATGLLASYFFARELAGFWLLAGQIFWSLALLGSFLLLFQFVRVQRARKKNLMYMTPIWYLIFVSICAAALNGKLIGIPFLPYGILGFAFCFYLLITPVLLRRLLFGPPFDQVQEPAKALMCATPSLILLSFLSLFPQLPMAFALTLLIVSQGFLFWLYVIMIGCFRELPFLPAYASFTFALGTSCLNLARFRDRYIPIDAPLYDDITLLARIEMIVAAGVILYLLGCFLFSALAMPMNYSPKISRSKSGSLQSGNQHEPSPSLSAAASCPSQKRMVSTSISSAWRPRSYS